MTLGEALLHYQQLLQPATDPSEAKAMSLLLLEHVTQIDRNELHKQHRTLLSTEQQEKLSQLAARVVKGEPLQYALGEAWFCGLKLMVNQSVLIPRPETEELVEWIIANCRFPVSTLQIVDAGTGSGCIALALKRRIRKASVTALDIDPAALAVARHNAIQLGIDIDCLQADLLNPSAWSHLPMADLIVSNPPYISEQEKESMSHTVLGYEPHLALFAPGSDPLLFYRMLSQLAKEKLRSEGQVFLELNAAYASDIAELFVRENFQVALKEDMQGKKRMLRAWR